MKITKLDHIGIAVKNMDEALAFYRDTLGISSVGEEVIEEQNVKIGKFTANYQDALINFYYTPTILTTNSLVFDQEQMTKWWKSGYLYAASRSEESSELEL